MTKFINTNALEMDLIHDLLLNNDIGTSDLIAYIIWRMNSYPTIKEYERSYILDGKKYKVSIKELDND